MPAFSATGVRFAGVAAAVPGPSRPVSYNPAFPADELAKIMGSTGVKSRHIAPAGVCASDLCAAAAERLVAGLKWEKDSVDLLVFVSQTPDYVLPATACSLHARLGLSKACAAFDVNLGCSGYVYGLSIAAMHIQCGAASRALVLAGDTISRITSADDRSVAFLFGDAGTATALEAAATTQPMHFVTFTDGAGAENLSVSAGMFRQPSNDATRTMRVRGPGVVRTDEQLHMNGPEIFNFTIREVPAMVGAILRQSGWYPALVDAFVFHQANRFILEFLAKRMKLPPAKVPLALENYGNTSSASIPLTLCSALRDRLHSAPARLVLAGFGVGFSWAAAAIEVDVPHVECVLSVEPA